MLMTLLPPLSLTFSSLRSSLCDSSSLRILISSPETFVLVEGPDLPLPLFSLAAVNSSVRTLYVPRGWNPGRYAVLLPIASPANGIVDPENGPPPSIASIDGD